MSGNKHRYTNTILADLEQKVCDVCDGGGQTCGSCEYPISDCGCDSVDRDHAPCDACNGSGVVFIDFDAVAAAEGIAPAKGGTE